MLAQHHRTLLISAASSCGHRSQHSSLHFCAVRIFAVTALELRPGPNLHCCGKSGELENSCSTGLNTYRSEILKHSTSVFTYNNYDHVWDKLHISWFPLFLHLSGRRYHCSRPQPRPVPHARSRTIGDGWRMVGSSPFEGQRRMMMSGNSCQW